LLIKLIRKSEGVAGMEKVMIKEIREIKSMISELSSFLLKAMDMENSAGDEG